MVKSIAAGLTAGCNRRRCGRCGFVLAGGPGRIDAAGRLRRATAVGPGIRPDVPRAQLTSLLNSLADPNMSFVYKGSLVEGGIETEASPALAEEATDTRGSASFQRDNRRPPVQPPPTFPSRVQRRRRSRRTSFVNQGTDAVRAHLCRPRERLAKTTRCSATRRPPGGVHVEHSRGTVGCTGPAHRPVQASSR